MAKWEYVYAKFSTEDSVHCENGQELAGGSKPLHEYLKEKGKAGWELVAIEQTGRLFLKRPWAESSGPPKKAKTIDG